MIFKNRKGQIVGELRSGIYRRQANRSKHFFKMYAGWGIDSEILNDLLTMDCQEIRIKDNDATPNVVYACKPEDFMNKGIYVHYDGSQYVLPIEHFRTYTV